MSFSCCSCPRRVGVVVSAPHSEFHNPGLSLATTQHFSASTPRQSTSVRHCYRLAQWEPAPRERLPWVCQSMGNTVHSGEVIDYLKGEWSSLPGRYWVCTSTEMGINVLRMCNRNPNTFAFLDFLMFLELLQWIPPFSNASYQGDGNISFTSCFALCSSILISLAISSSFSSVAVSCGRSKAIALPIGKKSYFPSVIWKDKSFQIKFQLHLWLCVEHTRNKIYMCSIVWIFCRTCLWTNSSNVV